MEENPFAPPRTADLDGGVAPAVGTGPAIAEESLQELVATAPWTSWLVRLSVVSMVLGIIGAMVSIARAQNAIEPFTAIGGIIIAAPVTVVFIFILMRLTN